MPISSAKSSRAGYTIAELVAVLIIIALAMAIVGPRIVAGDSRDLRRAADQVETAAAHARALAMRSGADVVMRLDLDRGEITLEPQGALYRLPALDRIEAVVAESENGETGPGIRFFAEGGATGGRIDIEHGEGQRHILVNWLTGRAGDVEPDD